MAANPQEWLAPCWFLLTGRDRVLLQAEQPVYKKPKRIPLRFGTNGHGALTPGRSNPFSTASH